MCGRFTLSSPPELIAEAFDLATVPAMSPRYNIAPSQPVATVRLDTDGRRALDSLRWGLVPGWAKDPAIGNRMINARSETVHEKPAFRAAFRKRRCLVVADGFFEWRSIDGARQPVHVCMRDHRPFAFAGLWERWQAPGADPVDSCTIITTSANTLMAPIHDRMPVILPPAHYAAWLDPATSPPATLQSMLVPWAGEDLTARDVDRRVNNPRNDDPGCIAPLH